MEQNLTQLSDQEVIDRVLSGAIGLYEIIVRRYNPDLYKVGRAMDISHEDTQDLMQDAFVAAYKHLSQYKGLSAFKTWLISIMLHQCYRRLKQSSFNNETSFIIQENQQPMFPRDSNDPSQMTQRRELAHILESALMQVPEDYRLVFSLREINGLSTAETATLLSISESNVKVRLNRAKTMLRQKLERKYHPAELFEFNLIYCDAIVAGVMQKISEI